MSLFKSFNPSDLDALPMNGDSMPDLEILEPTRLRSDFDISAPPVKADKMVQKAIDEICAYIVQDPWSETGIIDKDSGEFQEKKQWKDDNDAKSEALETRRTLEDNRNKLEETNNQLKTIQPNSGEYKKLIKLKEELEAGIADLEARLKKLQEEVIVEKISKSAFVQLLISHSRNYRRGKRRKGGRLPGSGGIFLPRQYWMKQELLAAGLTGEIGKTSARIRKSSIDNNLRLLLSNEPIYVACLYRAFTIDKVKDSDGFFNRILLYADQAQDEVNELVAEDYFESSHLDDEQLDKSAFLELIRNSRFSYASGRPATFMKTRISSMMKYGRLPKYVNDYFAQNEIPASKGTTEIKTKMVEYLYKLDLQISGDSLPPDQYDEYFANAYAYAAKLGTSDSDPVRNVYSDISVDSFDFKVDYFDDEEGQYIDRKNILGAGVLFYTKVLADDLGILRIADAILMAWTQGKLDIPQGETATKLYRYYKLRKERSTAEERAMFYKIVFNTGDAEVLENSVVNTEFAQLWTVLMNETVKYIQKFEANDNAFEYVSKIGVYHAIKNLQYNLSVFMSGMIKALLPEMYAQLQSAIDLLKRPEIVQQLGQGYQRNMWKVIERVSSDAFGVIPNVAALRTIAVKGHSIFTDIAQFDEASYPEEKFRALLDNITEFITANGNVEEMLNDIEDDAEAEPEEKDDWKF